MGVGDEGGRKAFKEAQQAESVRLMNAARRLLRAGVRGADIVRLARAGCYFFFHLQRPGLRGSGLWPGNPDPDGNMCELWSVSEELIKAGGEMER